MSFFGQFVYKFNQVLRKLFITFIILSQVGNCFAQQTGYLAVLKRAAQYNTNDERPIPAFTYQNSNDKRLVALRKKYKLDSIAGFGNEQSRLLNIMHWVHNTVHHNGSVESGITAENADTIITTCIAKNIGVSCGELASVLNDCYLAMGCPSRKVYCFPKDSLHNDNDSHVINIVYLSGKKKWIWVDPTNDAYVMDEKGDLLSIEEVRERLINGQPLILNPDANWNHRMSREKDEYLEYYMAKNLYQLYSPLHSEYDYESAGKNKEIVYVHLLPLDYSKQTPDRSERYSKYHQTNVVDYLTNNPGVFWQKPY